MSYQDTGLIFAGNVYMAPLVNDVAGSYSGPINVSKLELTPPQPQAVNRTSYQRDTYGQALDSVNLPGEAPQLSMDFDSLPARLLADALAGTVEDYSASPGTGVSETVTLVEGLFIRLGQRHITAASVTVTPTGGGGALVAGTDYKLEPETGLIMALNPGAAVEVTVQYDHAERTGNRVLGATELTKPRSILMDGKNLVTGDPAQVEIFKVSFGAEQVIDLMQQGEFITATLAGTMITPQGKPAPYTIIM